MNTKYFLAKFFSYQVTLFSVILLLVTACHSTKYLEDGQYYIKENNVKLTNNKQEKNIDKIELKDDVLTLIKPTPNSEFLKIPLRLGFYKFVDEPSDTSKFKNWLRDKIAEKPSITDTALISKSMGEVSNFLKNRGYFSNEISLKLDTLHKKRKVIANYEIELNQLYKIDSFNLVSKDSQLVEYLGELSNNSLFKKNTPIDNNLYISEVNRISAWLRNKGYAYLFPNYISNLKLVEKDSVLKTYDATMYLYPPNDENLHKRYQIGNVSVKYASEILYDESIHDSITYQIDGSGYHVLPKYLNRNIFLRPGDTYSLEKMTKSINRLNLLNVFQVASIRPQTNDSTNVMDLLVDLKPAKKYTLGVSLEGNFSQEPAIVRQNFVGTSIGLQFKDRNIAKSASQLTVSTNFGVEVNLNKTDTLSLFETSINSELKIPRFVEVGTISFLHSLRFKKKPFVISDKFYNYLLENADTKIRNAITFQDRLGFYKTNSFELSFGFKLKPNNRVTIEMSQAGVDLLLNEFDDNFRQNVLNSQPFLEKSLGSRLLTGFLIKDLVLTIEDLNPFRRFQNKFETSIEFSGLEVNVANFIFNNLDEPFSVGNDLRFAHFVKLGLDFVSNINVTNSSSFAFRSHFTIAAPYSRIAEEVPFIKQPFIGGPFSLRGWQARELGPGSYNSNQTQTTAFFQTGNIKMEMNAEYRFKLWWIIEGAAFLDVGNIWTLKEDPDRAGAQISNNFINEIAMSTGLGIRFVFPYFTFRWDMGIPIRTPYKNENGRHGLTTNQMLKKANFSNLALGFPF